MNLTIDSKILADALSVAFTSSQMEIYENVLVETKGKQVTITSQDGIKQRITSLPANSSKPGRTVINPKPIRGVLAGLTGDVELNLRTSKNDDPSSIVIKQDSKIGSRKYDFKVMSADAYPVFDQTADVEWDVDCEALAAAMQEVAYAAGQKSPHSYLNSVFIGRNAVVGCDSYRAAIVEFETGNVEMIVPIDCVNSIQQFMANGGEDIKATYHQAGDQFYRIGLDAGGQQVSAKLLNGKYIDFTRVVPKDENAKFVCKVNREELLKAIERLIAGRSFEKLIKMYFVPESETVIRVTGTGDLTDYVACSDAKNSGVQEIAINAMYMRDAIRAMTSEYIWLFAKDDTTPVWFRPEGGKSIHFIVPIR